MPEIVCRNCGNLLTRPTDTTLKTKTCRNCRTRERENEAIKVKPIESEESVPPNEKKEVITINKSEPVKGKLQEMRIQRVDNGILLTYKSPIMQSYFKTWYQTETCPEAVDRRWVSSNTPLEQNPRIYQYLNSEYTKTYKNLVYFQYGSNKLVDAGRPNLGFIQSTNVWKIDNEWKYGGAHMDPTQPIEVEITGSFPNSILDDFMQRTKEVIYKIYSDNLMPYDKTMVISFEEKDEAQNAEAVTC